MTDIEQLITDALRRQETRAPNSAPVLAALRRSADRPRARVRGLVVAVAAAVVVALGVPVGLSQFTSITAMRVASGPEPTRSEPAITLRYTAGWLPDGFHEVYRGAGVAGVQQRRWANGPVGADPGSTPTDTSIISLTLHTPAEPNWADTGAAISEMRDKVTVQGHPAGFARVDNLSARLLWMPAEDTILQVTTINLPDSRQVAIRVAESVRADGSAALQPEIKFGALPAPLRELNAAVTGDSARAAATVLMAGDPTRTDGESPTVTVTLSRQAPELTGGQPVTVRGRPGTYAPPPDRRNTEHNDFGPARVAVALPDGRWLTLAAPGPTGGRPTSLSAAELTAILDGVVFGPPPDHSWLGGS